jgi:hypothetical protein
LLDLFIAVDGEIIIELEQYKQQEVQLSITATPLPQALLFGQEAIPVLQGKSSESQVGSHLSDTSIPIFLNKLALQICIASGVASVALMIGSYYSLRPPVPAVKVQQYPSLLRTNTSLGNITLAST